MAYDQMAFVDKGSGPPLVLLHAFPLNRCMWNAQLEYLSNWFRVIAPDYHGFGDSPIAAVPFSLESLADDIAGLLESLDAKEPFTLLGLSMGGYVAFEFLRKYRQRLGALILAATHPALDSEIGRQARYDMAELVRREGTGIIAERMAPRLLGKSTLETCPEMAAKIKSHILRNQPEGIAQACLAMAVRRDSTDLLEHLDLPTLILSGAEDSIVPGMPPAVMQQKIAGSTWHILEKSGHLLNLEQAEIFNNIVRQYLQSL